MNYDYLCSNCGARFHGSEERFAQKKRNQKRKDFLLYNSLDCGFCNAKQSLQLDDSYGFKTAYNLNDKSTWNNNERKFKVSKHFSPDEKALKKMVDADGYLTTTWPEKLDALRSNKKPKRRKRKAA